jgi:hypothetical protein
MITRLELFLAGDDEKIGPTIFIAAERMVKNILNGGSLTAMKFVFFLVFRVFRGLCF